MSASPNWKRKSRCSPACSGRNRRNCGRPMARKVLYSADRVRAMFAKMRGDLHTQHFAHLCEMSDLRKELDAMRAELEQLREFRATVCARQQAEAELAELHRQRSLTQAWTAPRDPATPLQ